MNVKLAPLSPRAQQILTHTLHSDPICSLEQLRDGAILVVSPARSFCRWIKTEGDPDWAFTFTRETTPAPPGSQPS